MIRSFDFTYKLGNNPQTLFARNIEAINCHAAKALLISYWADNVHEIHSVSLIGQKADKKTIDTTNIIKITQRKSRQPLGFTLLRRLKRMR